MNTYISKLKKEKNKKMRDEELSKLVAAARKAEEDNE